MPGPFETIQDAVDAASDGDEIVVADGVYSGVGNKNIDFEGKTITLRSENGPQACIIDCEYNGRGFYFHSGETESAMIDGFTVTKGRLLSQNVPGGPFGAGVHIAACGPVIKNCIFINNSIEVAGARRGGGLYTTDGNPKIINCVFVGNSVNSLSMKLNGSKRGTNLEGGAGLYVQQGNPIIDTCVFDSNITDGYGGGIASSGNATISDCTFVENEAFAGGGLIIDHGGGALNACTFQENDADTVGGGAYLLASSTSIDRCTFTFNDASGGGAIEIFGISSDPTITRCRFTGNTAVSGAAVRTFQATSTIVNSLFLGNAAASQGGALRTYLSTANVVNCGFAMNHANLGGAVSTGELGHTLITNSILWDNTANNGSQIGMETGARKATTTVAHCDSLGGEAAVFTPVDTTLNWGEGNIDVDPQFADLDGSDNRLGTFDDLDLRLTFDSPCVDKGDDSAIPPGLDLDLNGLGRFHNHPASANYGKSVVDLGPFEFYAAPGDINGDGAANIDDLVQVILTWGGCFEDVCPADLTDDGAVRVEDLLMVLNNWTL